MPTTRTGRVPGSPRGASDRTKGRWRRWESATGRLHKTGTVSSKTASASGGSASWGGHHLKDALRIWGVESDALEFDRVCAGDQWRPEPQRVAHQPRRRTGTLPHRLLELDADDPTAGATQRSRFDLAVVGLSPIAPVQPAGDPVPHVGFERDAKVDGGVDRHDALGGDGTRAEDTGQLPGAVQRGRLEPLEQQGQDERAVEHRTNLIRPGDGGGERPDRSESAGYLTVDVVERVGELSTQRPCPPHGTRSQIEDLLRDARIGLVDLYSVQAAGVAEVAPDADRAALIVGAECEQVRRPEGERAFGDAVMRELPGVQERV